MKEIGPYNDEATRGPMEEIGRYDGEGVRYRIKQRWRVHGHPRMAHARNASMNNRQKRAA